MGRQREQSSQERTFQATALVFVGCYLGASVDVWARFPEVGSAVVFLPYAIVTVALWQTLPRQWWIFILAAAAGAFPPHRLGGDTTAFALAAEMVNAVQAVLAAIGLRHFTERPGRLESLREVVVFVIVAVFLAPVVGALAG